MKVFSIAKGFHRLAKNTPLALADEETNRLRALRLYLETKDVGRVGEEHDYGDSFNILGQGVPFRQACLQGGG